MVKLLDRLMEAKTPKEVSKKDIEVAAYFHWLERGCPFNDDLTDWVEAEKWMNHRSAPVSKREND